MAWSAWATVRSFDSQNHGASQGLKACLSRAWGLKCGSRADEARRLALLAEYRLLEQMALRRAAIIHSGDFSPDVPYFA